MKVNGYEIKPFANLSRANLSRANLSRANLSWANLHGANLNGADLYEADLHGANLHGADLHGANLHGANLNGADLNGADLRGADLYGADLYGADLGTTWIMLIQDLTDAISLADMIFHEWANKGIENAKERFGLYQQPGENRALIMLTPNLSGGYCFVLERREIWWWNWSCPDPETVPVLWRQTKEGGDIDEA